MFDGYLCRAVVCVCPPGQGHNGEAYARYTDALDRGFSDYEAREEGWPWRCDPPNDVHVTPHRGCIMR